MKRLLKESLLFFCFLLHCSSCQMMAKTTFGFEHESPYQQTLSLVMQVWAQLQDVPELEVFAGDDTIGKLFRIYTHVSAIIENKQFIFLDDKRYLAAILQQIRESVNGMDMQSELSHALLTLLDQIEGKMEQILSFG